MSMWEIRQGHLTIGLASAVVYVPLVAASMGMYSMEQYPTDHYFWQSLPTVPALAAAS